MRVEIKAIYEQDGDHDGQDLLLQDMIHLFQLLQKLPADIIYIHDPTPNPAPSPTSSSPASPPLLLDVAVIEEDCDIIMLSRERTFQMCGINTVKAEGEGGKTTP